MAGAWLTVLLYGICFWLLRLPTPYLHTPYIEGLIYVTFLMPIANGAVRIEQKTGLACISLVYGGLCLLLLAGLVGPAAVLLHLAFERVDLLAGLVNPERRQELTANFFLVGVPLAAVAVDCAVALSTNQDLATLIPFRPSRFDLWASRGTTRPIRLFKSITYYGVVATVFTGHMILLRISVFILFDRISSIFPGSDLVYAGAAALAAHYWIGQASIRSPSYKEDGQNELLDVIVQPEYGSGGFDIYIYNWGHSVAVDCAYQLIIPESILKGGGKVYDDAQITIQSTGTTTMTELMGPAQRRTIINRLFRRKSPQPLGYKNVRSRCYSGFVRSPIGPDFGARATSSIRIAHFELRQPVDGTEALFWWKLTWGNRANPEIPHHFWTEQITNTADRLGRPNRWRRGYGLMAPEWLV